MSTIEILLFMPKEYDPQIYPCYDTDEPTIIAQFVGRGNDIPVVIAEVTQGGLYVELEGYKRVGVIALLDEGTSQVIYKREADLPKDTSQIPKFPIAKMEKEYRGVDVKGPSLEKVRKQRCSKRHFPIQTKQKSNPIQPKQQPTVEPDYSQPYTLDQVPF